MPKKKKKEKKPKIVKDKTKRSSLKKTPKQGKIPIYTDYPNLLWPQEVINKYYRKEDQKELLKEEPKNDVKIERVEKNEEDDEKKSLDSFKYFGLEEEKTEPNTNEDAEKMKNPDQDKINSLKEFHIFNYEKIEGYDNNNWYNVGFSFSDCSFEYNTINKNI